MADQNFEIVRGQSFPTLSRAPIVEAVIQWEAAASVAVSDDELRRLLSDAFPGYQITPQQNFEAAIEGSADGVEIRQRSSREGYRLCSPPQADPLFVCQFKRDRLVFSRLHPYEGWDSFIAEGQKFWDKFAEVHRPKTIARVSVRYISQVAVPDMNSVADLLQVETRPLERLGVSSEGLFHQDTVKPGNLPYIIHVRRVVQADPKSETGGKSVILDIDVSTTDGPLDALSLEQRLLDLRYLKNKLFFDLINDPERHFGGTLS